MHWRGPLQRHVPLEPLARLRALAVLLEHHADLLPERSRPGRRPAARG